VKVVDPEGQPASDVEVDIKMDKMQFSRPVNEGGKVSFNVPGGGQGLLRRI
jgi:hypothetical protein